MSAQGARVINLQEYRRRREAQSENERPALMQPQVGMVSLAPVSIVWFPVWTWVPCWPIL